MKKLIITNCILAIAVIFTYCAKPNVNEEISTVNTDQVAVDRGGPCTITNIPPFNTATLTFCGTNTNATACVTCPPSTPAVGVLVVPPGSPVIFTLTGPATFSVTTNITTSLNLTTGGSQTGWVTIPANGCQRYTVDANCVITAVK